MSTQTMVKQRYNSFDFLKGLACIAVVLIHYNFSGNIGLAIKSYCRFGVPIFFFVSGFFMLEKGKVDDTNVCRKLRHIVSLIITSSCFYAVYAICWNHLMYRDWNIMHYMEEKLVASSIVKFFLTNDPFVYSHLWFLLALAYVYVTVLLFFHKPNRLKLIPFLAPLLLIGYSCLQEFGGALGIQRSLLIIGTENRVWLYNLFIFRALPFFLFGMLTRQHEEKLSALPIPKLVLIIGAAAGGCLSIVERNLFEEAQFYIGSYITVACMVLWALQKPESGVKPLIYVGRELSLYVYILHIAVGKAIDLVANKWRLWQHPVIVYGRAPMVLILSLLIALIIAWIKKYTHQVYKQIRDEKTA